MRFWYKHSIDIFTSQCISGWVMNPFQKKKLLHLRFVSGKITLGEILAKEYRKDLHLKNLHPNGLCGFDFYFPPYADLAAEKTLDIYLGNARRPFLRLDTSHLKSQAVRSLPQIFFMHIPKTAGTSFNEFMRLHVLPETYETHIEKYKEREYPALAQDNIYLAGHLTIEQIKRYFTFSDFDLYSIVRDPHTHLHSHLNWLKGMAAHHGTKFLRRHNNDVQGLVAKIDALNFTDLKQLNDFVATLKNFELDFFDNCQTRYFLDYRPQKVSTDDFKNTLDNISLFRHIGITEEYDRFKQYITTTYNLPEKSVSSSFNKAMHGSLYKHTSPAIREVLNPLIETDILLYEHVKNEFGSY